METIYGVAMESELLDHIRTEFENLKRVIVSELADGLQPSDLPPILSQFVRSGVVIVQKLQAAPDREAVLLGAFMELYDEEIDRRLSFPYSEYVKPSLRAFTEQTAKMLIDLVVSMFNERVGGWPTGEEGA